jgi:parallel beta-helix repeat protein
MKSRHLSINLLTNALELHRSKPIVTWLSTGVTTLLLVTGGAIAPSVAQSSQPSSTPVAQLPADTKVIYVNPALGVDSTGRGDAESTPLRTITYALQQASEGIVIQLAPGSYTRDTGEVFPLVLKPGVSLRGDAANKGQTVAIIGSGEYVSPTFARQNVTILAQGNSDIAGVTVTNPNTRGTGVWVESTNPTIRNSTFINSLREGIFISGTGSPKIEGNVFTANKGNGVSVTRDARGEIRGNVFQNTGFGITISDNAAPLVADNQIINNIDGVVVSNAAHPTLRNNVIENNTRDGVVAIATAQPDMGTSNDNPGRNSIRNNGRYSIYNATRSNMLVAVGNEVDSDRISGKVSFVATDGPPSRFSDVSGHWAQRYIDALAAKDIIGGFPDGSYRPNEPVTRAQFAAIVSKAFNPNAKRSSINFGDVRRDFWGWQAIETAYQGGFMSGYPGQVFQPNQAIPRVQALVSLVNGLGLTSNNVQVLSQYQDAAQIPNWATDAIAAATQQNLVVNYPNVAQFNPNQIATRGEVAAFIYQALVNAGRAEPVQSPYIARNTRQ